MNGMTDNRRVFFRPNLSQANPAANGPMEAPRGSNEPIQALSVAVMGFGKGLSNSEDNFGSSGDVHPKAWPHVKAAKLPVKEN